MERGESSELKKPYESTLDNSEKAVESGASLENLLQMPKRLPAGL